MGTILQQVVTNALVVDRTIVDHDLSCECTTSTDWFVNFQNTSLQSLICSRNDGLQVLLTLKPSATSTSGNNHNSSAAGDAADVSIAFDRIHPLMTLESTHVPYQ